MDKLSSSFAATSTSSPSSWIPPSLLGKWLLFVSSLAILNCVQNYIDYQFSRKVYTSGGASVTPLSARTFGTWNLLSAVVRFYAAYNLHSKPIYEACMWTYVIALGHFGSEVLAFKTAKFTAGIISPLIVASTSLATMALQYRHYIR
ncbi:Erg28-domain-containing protein [Tilletiaria anomala UBC 951]|uniref:Erg28-domain-containing protein n=1 Tax=Tilletiaria anomala (strain ATCC 24038 / CBS 436.72 / UBC 951) TaxID=1037660 RepID=A0A066WKX6_TILAU|nr:Erg28-domain-containing protein [Tilletiaria anomala UBC 951]KDN53228.1 Erg28-domain-containing protein [Tilletiaria anomala UBC 951]